MWNISKEAPNRNQRMAEIFKKNGFPQEFFDDMLGAVEAPDGDQEGGR